GAHQQSRSLIRELGKGLVWAGTGLLAVALVMLSTLAVVTPGNLPLADIVKIDEAAKHCQAGATHYETRPEISQDNFKQALMLFPDLQKRHPDNAAISHQLVKMHVILGNVALKLGQLGESEAYFTEALKLMDTLVRNHPNDPESKSYPRWTDAIWMQRTH